MLFPVALFVEFGLVLFLVLFSLGFLSSGPRVVRTIGTFRFMGPTVTRSSVVPDLGISTGVGNESTDEDSGSFLFLLGVGVCMAGLLCALSLGL